MASGMINLVFDYIFIVVFGWALAGAAWATVIAEITGGLLPVLYFLVNRKGGIIFIPALTLHGGPAESLQQWSLSVSNRIFHVLSGHGL